MKFEILWHEEFSDFFKYGSKIKYEKDGTVNFENELMTPGENVITWNSKLVYQGNRSFLQLPILRRGTKYELSVNVKSIPEDKIFVTITFFDRSENIISIKALNEIKNEFLYPLETYSYAISLVNKGARNIIFKKLTIKDIKINK